MTEEWMPYLELRITHQQFQQLPRQAGYAYSYFDGVAWLSPRPRYYHAILDLTALPTPPPAVPGFSTRPLSLEDWTGLPPVFASAFARQLPFSGIDADNRLRAARQSLDQTRRGGDGPLIPSACHVATTPDGNLLGGALATLLPDTEPTSWDSFYWLEPPPEDALERRIGRPHLTWVFVANPAAGNGIGTTLLHDMAASLRRLGYNALASTFLLGNDSSMLWHWRNGFELVSHPASRRRAE
jgi:GNAT superfamily N-acetyltransferase